MKSSVVPAKVPNLICRIGLLMRMFETEHVKKAKNVAIWEAKNIAPTNEVRQEGRQGFLL